MSGVTSGPRSIERIIESTSIGMYGCKLRQPCPVSDSDLLITSIYSAGYCYLNAIARSLLGLADTLPNDHSLFDFLLEFPENRQTIIRFIRNEFVLPDGITKERCADGCDRYFVTSMLGTVQDGHLIEIWGTKTDITVEKMTELALRTSEERYRLTIDSLTDLVHVINRQFELILVNAPTRKAIGEISPGIQQIEGTDLFVCFPFLTSRVRDEYMRVMLTRQILKTEESNEVNHEVIWTETHKIPIIDDSGQLFGIITIIRDISAARRSDLALQLAEKKYRDLVESLDDAIYQVSRSGIIEYISPAISSITGFSPEEMTGRHFIEFIPSEEQADIVSLFENSRDRTRSSRRFHILRRDGTTCPVRASLRALIENGEFHGIRGVVEDMSAQVEVEQEKERLHTQLVRSQKLEEIGILAGGIAHDFNNLLTVIQGHTQLSLIELPESHPVHTELRQIQQTLTRASNLTRQLLIFSRKETIQFRPVNLNATIANILKMIRRMIPENIEMTSNLSDQPWMLLADEGSIEQVVLNICVNARDAMPSGGVLTITTDTVLLNDAECQRYPMAHPGHFSRVTFEDTGVGISVENLEKIFDPFFTTKEKGRGTGLGLSIVYGIIKQHGGWIRINSEVGNGTKFEIFLPAGKPLSVAMQPEDPKLNPLMGNGQRVLLVEDDLSVRQLLERILEKHRYVVYSADSVARALELLQENGPCDLLFADIMLPDGDGIMLARQLLNQYPTMAVLFGTGYPESVLRIPALDRARFRVISKPYRLMELMQEIQKQLTQRKQE